MELFLKMTSIIDNSTIWKTWSQKREKENKNKHGEINVLISCSLLDQLTGIRTTGPPKTKWKFSGCENLLFFRYMTWFEPTWDFQWGNWGCAQTLTISSSPTDQSGCWFPNFSKDFNFDLPSPGWEIYLCSGFWFGCCVLHFSESETK